MNVSSWLVTLNGDEITLYLIAASAMMLACLGLVFYYLRRARLIEDMPTSRIRSAAQGYVELIGTVSRSEMAEMVAPLSGIPCVWFDYKVQRYRRAGKSGHWHTITQGTSKQCFQIDDGTGTCSVNPQGAEVITEHSRTWHGDSEMPRYRVRNNNPILRVLRGHRYRYIEKFIYIHDVVYALGHFQSSGGGRQIPSHHELMGAVIREWKQNYQQLLQRFDSNNKGEIDLQEWEQVRQAASKEAEIRHRRLSNMPTTYTLSNTTNKRHPFIISTHSQRKLSEKFRCYAVVSLITSLFSGYFLIILADKL
ncbi:E3 Ubiquitin ligase [Nitrosomonas cryotolerans]|uniref:RING-type E3 ubiquitin transferase n=1 Tax=Nitrosomonas cryotolerans ATCC 49181 TaxID=1131553 RepID=A0A1N6J5C9_9PROT|nr:GIDE domain-containing protein [Nitrosomonas cryotolerans]SFP46051.1 E3 Ubiquitin ligase [Nitrosomonas cryotolerans]SIO39443.1 E3 Ubiquitin ligase [Nitrosomonas cryotolerans ATCC 49181]